MLFSTLHTVIQSRNSMGIQPALTIVDGHLDDGSLHKSMPCNQPDPSVLPWERGNLLYQYGNVGGWSSSFHALSGQCPLYSARSVHLFDQARGSRSRVFD